MTGLDAKIQNAFGREKFAQIIFPSVSWVLAILIFLLHCRWASLSQEGENLQRAGAAIVCVDIIAFSLMTFFTITALSVAMIGGRTPSKLAVLSAVSMALLAVCGTAIWGYGDIWFEKLS